MRMRSTVVAALAAGAVAWTSTAGVARLVGVDTTGSRLYEIDPSDGSTTLLVNISGGGTIGALAFDSSTNTLFAASTSLHQLYTIDINTGVATLVGSFGLSSPFMHGLEYNSANGRLYGVDFATRTLYDINKNTGQATAIGATGRAGFGSLGWDPVSNRMFYADTGDDSLYTVNLSDGSTTLVGAFGVAAQVGVGMAYHPGVGMLAMNNSGNDGLYGINLNTGQATLIGETGTSNIISLAYIPSPGGLAVLLLAGALGKRRRR